METHEQGERLYFVVTQKDIAELARQNLLPAAFVQRHRHRAAGRYLGQRLEGAAKARAGSPGS